VDPVLSGSLIGDGISSSLGEHFFGEQITLRRRGLQVMLEHHPMPGGQHIAVCFDQDFLVGLEGQQGFVCRDGFQKIFQRPLRLKGYFRKMSLMDTAGFSPTIDALSGYPTDRC